MRHVKHLLSLIGIIFIMASFSQCGNAQYNLESTPPHSLNTQEAYYQVSYPGIREGNTYVNVYFPAAEGVVLDSLYFKGQKAKFNLQDGQYVAVLVQESKEKLILDEVGSTPKKIEEKEPQETIPFDLQPEECVISYEESGKVKYLKLDAIRKNDLLLQKPMAPNKGGGIKQ